MVDAAQTQSNEATANFQSNLNNTNVVGPTGDVTYTQNPSNNQWTQTTSLSPQEQSIFNAGTAAQSNALGVANNQLGNVANALNTQVTPTTPLATGVNPGPIQYGFQQSPALQYGFSAGGPIQSQVGAQDINQSVSNATNAAYNAQTQYLNPQWAQNTEAEQAQLTAQGLNPNDAAYGNAMQIFGGQENQAYQGAMNAAVAAGDQEQNTLFGQQLSGGQFANAAQAQQYGENQGQAQFANTSAGQQFNQNASAAGFGNTAQQQAFSQGLSNAGLYDSAAAQNFQNQAYAQELPINEFNSLMASGQVQAPTSTAAQTAVAPTDVLGAYSLQQGAEQADYAAQLQSYNSGLSGLFNLGSAALNLAGL